MFIKSLICNAITQVTTEALFAWLLLLIIATCCRTSSTDIYLQPVV